MTDTPAARIFPPIKGTQIDRARYEALYRQSLETPDAFWLAQAKRLDWVRTPSVAGNWTFDPATLSIKWYEDGILNACFNCVDRHLPARGGQAALLWEGDEPEQSRTITYAELKDEVSRLANALKSLGVRKGDRVTIYLPMIPEMAFAVLACARIGTVHSVVFGGFSPESLRDRILDCESDIVLTAEEGHRGGKHVPLRANVEEALRSCPHVRHIVTLASPSLQDGREITWHDWHALVGMQSADCPCEPMQAEDPLFILYTSGSTGKPKGVLHTTAGYLVYASLTHEWVFDYRDGEVYWCTADIGWVTGHSYIVYGPLANGATSLMFEGIPSYPDFSRFWQIVDKYRVNIFYTAPTAIRALLREGDAWVKKTDRGSLRILGSVGEPINSEAWLWFHDVVGDGRCPIVDTWWQTETGGHLITPLPGATTLKPGSATKPFFGIRPVIVDSDGNEIPGPCEGPLCIAASWPGQMRTVYKDHARFVQTYFSTFAGYYFTGDGARRDEDGDYWITGRIDDVINVSGHRFGTAEIESAINRHPFVSESAVVGYPHDLKGQGIYAYVIPKDGAPDETTLRQEITGTVRQVIGPIASPDIIQLVAGLPKTRSGKIMRRILRKIAADEIDTLGDISTLAEPGIVDALIHGRPGRV